MHHSESKADLSFGRVRFFRMRIPGKAVLRVLLFLSLLIPDLSSAAEKEILRILQTTDLHGESGFFTRKSGVIRLASVIRREREEHGGENVLYIDCGDLLQGTFSAAQDRGESMLEALNLLKCDVWVPGNHDFDFGTAVLADRIRSFRGTVLAANLIFEKDLPPCRKWALFHRAGFRIAVIGCIPPYLSHWLAPAQMEGVRTKSVEEAVAEVMPEIERAKPDLIILAVHEGRFTAGRLRKGKRTEPVIAALPEKFPGIRVILGGHTHEEVLFDKFWPDTVYVQAPALADGLAEVTVRKQGDDLVFQTRLFRAADEKPDPELLNFFRPLETENRKRMNEPAACIPFVLKPEQGGKPSPAAGLTAEAVRTGTGADAAFCSVSGKVSIGPGRITERDIFLLMPYENLIRILTLTEEQTRSILEEQLTVSPKGSYLHVSGLEYEADPQGKIRGRLRIGGIPWPEGKTARIAFSAFDASGAGGRFPVLRKLSSEHGEDTPFRIRELFRRYLLERYPGKK